MPERCVCVSPASVGSQAGKQAEGHELAREVAASVRLENWEAVGRAHKQWLA